MNKSARVLQQQALSETFHNGPRMVAQRYEMDAAFGGKAKPQGDGAMPTNASPMEQEEKANSAGLRSQMAPGIGSLSLSQSADRSRLPAQLKHGIEMLSGMSMDHVRVHYNSSHPAQLNALAYAQGSDIHIASGQERHLPHEAWHIVQQAQGRVRPTMQMKGGTLVNDDTGLEREADVMGAKALASVSSRLNDKGEHTYRVGSGQVIQRAVKWGRKADTELDNYAGKLDELVTEGAQAALEPDSLPITDKYITLWQDTAKMIIEDRNSKDAKLLRPFAAARYGYAVESYVNAKHKDIKAPDGCEVTIQGTRGMTRPDFIMRYRDGSEVGWFDITSEASIGHIYKKAGSGWTSKPYVAEITYDPLDISSVADSNIGIGERVLIKNKAKKAKKSWSNLVNVYRMRFEFNYLTAKNELISTPNKEKTRELARSAMAMAFDVDDFSPKEVKSLLSAFGLAPSAYRYDGGGQKSEGNAILERYLDVGESSTA